MLKFGHVNSEDQIDSLPCACSASPLSFSYLFIFFIFEEEFHVAQDELAMQ